MKRSRGGAALAAPASKPDPRKFTIAVKLRDTPRYVPGSGPRSRPITLAPERDSTAYIIDQQALPPYQVGQDPDNTKTGVRRLLYYHIGFTDLPAAKILVPCNRALDYLSPAEIEDWEHESAGRREKERAARTEQQAQQRLRLRFEPDDHVPTLAEGDLAAAHKKSGRPRKRSRLDGAVSTDDARYSPASPGPGLATADMTSAKLTDAVAVVAGPSLMSPQKRRKLFHHPTTEEKDSATEVEGGFTTDADELAEENQGSDEVDAVSLGLGGGGGHGGVLVRPRTTAAAGAVVNRSRVDDEARNVKAIDSRRGSAPISLRGPPMHSPATVTGSKADMTMPMTMTAAAAMAAKTTKQPTSAIPVEPPTREPTRDRDSGGREAGQISEHLKREVGNAVIQNVAIKPPRIHPMFAQRMTAQSTNQSSVVRSASPYSTPALNGTEAQQPRAHPTLQPVATPNTNQWQGTRPAHPLPAPTLNDMTFFTAPALNVMTPRQSPRGPPALHPAFAATAASASAHIVNPGLSFASVGSASLSNPQLSSEASASRGGWASLNSARVTPTTTSQIPLPDYANWTPVPRIDSAGKQSKRNSNATEKDQPKKKRHPTVQPANGDGGDAEAGGPEAEEQAPAEWEVERLLADKRDYNERGRLTTFYQVLWKGDWPPSDNPTWEPRGNIPRGLVKQYAEEKAAREAQERQQRELEETMRTLQGGVGMSMGMSMGSAGDRTNSNSKDWSFSASKRHNNVYSTSNPHQQTPSTGRAVAASSSSSRKKSGGVGSGDKVNGGNQTTSSPFMTKRRYATVSEAFEGELGDEETLRRKSSAREKAGRGGRSGGQDDGEGDDDGDGGEYDERLGDEDDDDDDGVAEGALELLVTDRRPDLLSRSISMSSGGNGLAAGW